MIRTSRPHFRFFPDALDRPDLFERSSATCDGCGEPCDCLYKGSLYAPYKPSLCAWCIADGRVGRAINDDEFQFQDVDLRGVDAELAQEVLQRTPGVACYNPFSWPVRNAIPLAFIGYGDEPAILADPRACDAIDAAWRAETGSPLEGSCAYLLIFRSLDASTYEAVIDPDQGGVCSVWHM